jgi:hypothetical protein
MRHASMIKCPAQGGSSIQDTKTPALTLSTAPLRQSLFPHCCCLCLPKAPKAPIAAETGAMVMPREGREMRPVRTICRKQGGTACNIIQQHVHDMNAGCETHQRRLTDISQC